MSAVGQLHTQVARGANSVAPRSGLQSGGNATSTDLSAFLEALGQALGSRQTPNPMGNPNLQSQIGQNLPLTGNKLQLMTANNGDQSQLLSAQLASQGMLNQVTQSLLAQNASNNGNDASQNLVITNAALNTQVSATSSSGMNLSQVDSAQASMISLALLKAIRASGKDLNAQQQGQAASLLSNLQQAGLSTQGVQNTPQSLPQIASALQEFAQKNNINLPADVQAKLTDLMAKGNTGSIKLLSVGANGGNIAAMDLSRPAGAQNLMDLKLPTSLSAALDKAQKDRSFNGVYQANQGGNSGLSSSSPARDFGAQFNGTNLQKSSLISGSANSGSTIKDLNLRGPSDSSQGNASNLNQITDSVASASTDLKSANAEDASVPKTADQKTDLDPADPNAVTAFAGGMNRLEAQLPSTHHSLAINPSAASLASGPVHAQIMSAARSGGGRITLELTPPEQGTIRIDLRINSSGQAHLIVEGANDATKARLDQGGQSLKNEFAQMGLNLSLDMRQGGQSPQMREQAFATASQGSYSNNSADNQGSSAISTVNLASSGDNKGISNTVHLYA